jgi:hypothetical protein
VLLFGSIIFNFRTERSVSICGRPPRGRDFQRQYQRKPVRCHRTSERLRLNVLNADIEAVEQISTKLEIVAGMAATCDDVTGSLKRLASATGSAA